MQLSSWFSRLLEQPLCTRHNAFIQPLESRTLLAAIVPDGFSDNEVATGLFSPTAMAIANDGSNRIFVTEQTGDVRVVKNGQLAVGSVMSMTMSSDHRIVDGAMAAQYLATVKQMLEKPATLLV